jgi:tRNA 2-thiouridine synthesizing protein A
MTEGPGADVVVDARGLYCPIPVLRLAKALRGKPPGFSARLFATDPASVEDVEVFCRERSHALLESCCDGNLFTFLVACGPRN